MASPVGDETADMAVDPVGTLDPRLDGSGNLRDTGESEETGPSPGATLADMDAVPTAVDPGVPVSGLDGSTGSLGGSGGSGGSANRSSRRSIDMDASAVMANETDASPSQADGGHGGTSGTTTTGADGESMDAAPTSAGNLGAQTFTPRDHSKAPVVKLSVNLIHTYRHINEVYYAAKKRRKAHRGKGSEYDDEHFDYIVRKGDVLADRYELEKVIGRGSFGQVVRARDHRSGDVVAIKIIKNKKAFLQQAQTEIQLLEHMRRLDPDDSACVVRLREHFEFREHLCLVFEHLSCNLFELLRNTSFSGVSLMLVRKFAKQILTALQFMSHSKVNIIHCDLKPENILLRHPRRSAIKVIDFGSSCFATEKVYQYIQSRFYRAPEVILGAGYDTAIDMWSLGCILYEMHTGEPLFQGRNERDQMRKIVEVCGVPPAAMLAAGVKTAKFFDVGPDGSYTPKEAITRRVLDDLVRSKTKSRKYYRHGTDREYEAYIDLIQLLLAYDPADRITPADALLHPFVAYGSSHPYYGSVDNGDQGVGVGPSGSVTATDETDGGGEPANILPGGVVVGDDGLGASDPSDPVSSMALDP